MSGLQYNPFIVPIFVSALIAAGISLIARQHKTPSSRWLSLMMAAISLWSFTYGLELMQQTEPAMLFLVRIEYLGITTAPVFLFLFAFTYTGSYQQLTPGRIASLFVVPAIIVLLIWTNEYHNLMYAETGVMVINGKRMLDITPGPGYWINVLYTYGLIFMATLLLFLVYLKAEIRLYKRQIAFVLAGIIIPWLGSSAYVFLVSQMQTVDFTPVTFTIAGTAVAIGYYRFQLLDLMPTARSRLVETMQDAWLVLDQKNRLIDLNTATQELIGWNEDDIIGQQITTLLSADHPLLACLAIEGQSALEINLARTETIYTYSVRITPLPTPNQQKDGRLIVLHDITARKRAETALRTLNTSLENSVTERTAEIRAEKEKSDTILNTIDEGIVLVDHLWRIQYINNGMIRLIGKPRATLESEPLHALPLWEGSHGWKTITQTMLRGQSWQGETHLQHNNGRITSCLLATVPVTKIGLSASYLLIFRDISYLKKLEQARHRFITNISHELRTPISNLKLYLDLLETTTPTLKENHYAQVLRQQTARLEKLAQAVVDLARLDSSHGITEWQEFTVGELVTPLFTSLQLAAAKKEIALVMAETAERDLAIQGSADRLSQALAELIKNAITFSPAGSTITIDTCQRPFQDTDWTTISVIDEGPGIETAEHEKIYDRFYRGAAADTGTVPGLGLGLSIAWEIMKAHGSHITVDSQPGAGTTFTLWLSPLEIPEAETGVTIS